MVNKRTKVLWKSPSCSGKRLFVTLMEVAQRATTTNSGFPFEPFLDNPIKTIHKQ